MSQDLPDFHSFEWDDDAVDETPEAEPSPPVERQAVRRRRDARRRELDPTFLYAVLLALNVGLTPLAANAPIERYSLLWTLLMLAGIAGMMSDTQEPRLVIMFKPSNLLWGGGFGLLLGLPLLLVGPSTLAQASEQIFVGLPDGAVFQSIVFVMSTSESLFFRGVLQAERRWLTVASMASVWSIFLFFPTADLIDYPGIALIIATFIIMLNVLYSYVRQRNGLAAAWLAQIIVSLLWLFLPRLLVG